MTVWTGNRTAANGTTAARDGAARAAPLPRDHRIDVLRGFALLCMVWSHSGFLAFDLGLVGTVRTYAPTDIGFVSAAELFVFLSGYVFGLVNGPAPQAGGLAMTQLAALYRTWQLYVLNGFTLLVALAAVAVIGTTPALADLLRLTRIYHEPETAFLAFGTLRYAPMFFDILFLFMLLRLVAPIMLALMDRAPWLAAALSVGLYAAAQAFPWLTLQVNGRGWDFNPFAWQLLFFVGVALGRHGALADVGAAGRWRALLFAGGAILAVFALRVVDKAVEIGAVDMAAVVALFPVPWTGKTTLEPFRLIYTGLFIYAALLVLPRSHAIATRWWARPLAACGRNSLEVFCATVVANYCAVAAELALGGGVGPHFGLMVLAIVAVVAFGMVTDAVKSQPWRRRRTTGQDGDARA